MSLEPTIPTDTAPAAQPREVPVTAVALSGTIHPAEVAARLGFPAVAHTSYGVAVLQPEGARLWLFEFGAVVGFGSDGIDPGVRARIEAATGRTFLDGTAETWTVVIDPGRDSGHPRVGWDRVVLPDHGGSLAATALLLGQSAAVDREEHRADDLVVETLALSRAVEQRGRPHPPIGALVRRLGRISGDRLVLAASFYLLDRPEEVWEDPGVAALYDALFQSLELDRRHLATVRKLEGVQQATQQMVDLLVARRTYLLELAFVILFLAEIVSALILVGL